MKILLLNLCNLQNSFWEQQFKCKFCLKSVTCDIVQSLFDKFCSEKLHKLSGDLNTLSCESQLNFKAR